MVSHPWWRCAFPYWDRRSKCAVAAVVAVVVLASAVAVRLAGAAPARSAVAGGDPEPVDTEDMFGFVGGADIGNAGQQEVEFDATSLSGKSTGTYANTAAQFQYKYTAFANFRISALATFAFYDIADVSGLNGVQSAAVQSLSLDARFHLLDRDKGPFGLTLSVQPHWGFVDETSGVALDHIGWVALLLADRELVPNRIVGAINFLFDTDRTRLLPDHTIEQEPTPGIAVALTTQTVVLLASLMGILRTGVL